MEPKHPRARGAVITTTWHRFNGKCSQHQWNLATFWQLNPSYVDSFVTFSEEKLFSPVGSNIADLNFFVPGTTIPAVVRGFGAVYVDIDTDHTAFETLMLMASL